MAAIVADLSDDAPKLVYADWLDERGDERSDFLRAFVKASQSMAVADFPPAERLQGLEPSEPGAHWIVPKAIDDAFRAVQRGSVSSMHGGVGPRKK